MRSLSVVASLAVLAVGLLAVSSNESVGENSPSAANQPPLVVHEWGTFTNFSGSDGVQLEFRPLAHGDLPAFVQTCMDKWGLSFRKGRLSAFQRMETPVTYFYTPVERDVQVRVSFPEGLLTEFYPPVTAITPARPNDQVNFFSWPGQSPAGIPLKDSALDWGTVHLIPIEQLTTQVDDPVLAKSMGRFLAKQLVPDAQTFPHYGHARETDSALVNVHFEGKDRDADYFEKFLFYRGLGNFQLPLTLEAHGEGDYRLTNGGPEAIRSLFLVSISGKNGKDVRFRQYDRIDAGGELSLTEGAQTTDVQALAEAMAQALVAEGLYQKEADAMVNSWKDSWFKEQGTRLLYMVPSRITDELLPLDVQPQPDEVVRVLVGRMEIMSPEDEQQILELVQRSAAAHAAFHALTKAQSSAAADEARKDRKAAFQDLLALGRLAEPALVRARSISPEATTRDEAAQLIRELRAHFDKENRRR